ncbi:MAG: hypothetical protein ABI728_11730, partial [Betaproteobacteria bacterium]
AGHKFSLHVASSCPPGRISAAPKSTRRQKAAVRAIDNVGVFRCYIYPNRCTDASALPVISRLVDSIAGAVSRQLCMPMYALNFES